MTAYMALAEAEEDMYTKDGTTDYRNNPTIRNKTGTWKACPYILGSFSPFLLISIISFCNLNYCLDYLLYNCKQAKLSLMKEQLIEVK